MLRALGAVREPPLPAGVNICVLLVEDDAAPSGVADHAANRRRAGRERGHLVCAGPLAHQHHADTHVEDPEHLRLVDLEPGGEIEEETLAANEHWVVVRGTARVEAGGTGAELTMGDVAMLRRGTRRRIDSDGGARLALARTQPA